MRKAMLGALPLLVAVPATLSAQTPDSSRWVPRLLGAQFTLIAQDLAPFSALYSGPNSLSRSGDTEASHTYGVYFGVRAIADLQLYVDVEMARGAAISHALGLAGITNGDVMRQGSFELSHGPYVARAFLKYAIPLSRATDAVARSMDQLAENEPTNRLEVKAGKFAATDDFDQNRYANSTRSQFSNWGLFNNTAVDFAADTRGYTWGGLVGWVNPRWAVRLGSFLMPRFANGNTFDTDLRHARGDYAELTVEPGRTGAVVRLLAYQNHARMGVYTEALANAQGTGQPPNIVTDDRPGRVKYGFGLNIEQSLADSGETGAFLRLGWSDGRTESFAFTEVDRHLSAGLQVAGTHWRRSDDRLGIAYVVHGLSPDHRAYLAAGGIGFLLGDGRLNYGPEEIFETYYRLQVVAHTQLSADLQFIPHPGYNCDRGPATVISLRLNLRY
jgi:high affinity Mn2+ porin